MNRRVAFIVLGTGVATALWPAHGASGQASGVMTECPPNMVLVAAGTATLGAAGDPDALEPMTRTMSAFCIDRTEITVDEYLACEKAGGCRPHDTTVNFPGFGPPEPMLSDLSGYCNAPRAADHGQHPMNCIDEASAARYCASVGGRLPDEAEWEYAARGPSASRFPWGGNVPLAPGGDLCWDRRATKQGTCVVGSFPRGASPTGVLDMAGNVWEWTSSRLEDGFVVRGGGWTNFLTRYVSATFRWRLAPAMRLNCIGFRCVRSPSVSIASSRSSSP